ncbi:MAG: hypothetical protein ACK5IJ_07550 [Mangrovibacterium sp.]
MKSTIIKAKSAKKNREKFGSISLMLRKINIFAATKQGMFLDLLSIMWENKNVK